MSRDNPLNIFGIPYDIIETIRWILKHTIYDLIYPITLAFVGLFSFEFTEGYLMVFGICIAGVIGGYFVYYWIQTIRTREENIGDYIEECKWRVQTFNEMDEKCVVYEIGFVGDIMKMKDYTLIFDDNIKQFFKGVHLIVGNLEGIINDKKTLNIVRQKQRSKIIQNLTDITIPPPKWLLCISNNHSADFKAKGFFKTRNFIDGNCGFKAFGVKNESQRYSPIKGINIVSGTMWNNYKNKFASQFGEINKCYKINSFNILYPHWHYENECYTRRRMKTRCKRLLMQGIYNKFYKYIPKRLQRAPIKRYLGEPDISVKWDLIFGHHTHVPQPIIPIQNHLLAYSGGNFTSSKWINKHQHGLITRCQLARVDEKSPLVVRKIDWSYTKCERDRKGKKVHVNIDAKLNLLNSYDFRETKILLNLLVVSIIYLLVTPILSIWLSIPILDILGLLIKSLLIVGAQLFAVWLISKLLLYYKKLKSSKNLSK